MTIEAFSRHGIRSKIAVLGSVSLLMGIASTMVLSLLPAFLVKVIGASALWVGTIEGIAEATSSLFKILSGSVSDRIARRKPLVVLGYGLSAIAKLGFPLAHTVEQVLLARVLDRVGKGVRDAPRDAFVADMTWLGTHGTAFGLRHALFSVGTLLGPLIAIGCMWLTSDNFRLVYWLATVPGFLAVCVLLWGVNEVPPNGIERRKSWHFAMADLRRLAPAFWVLLAFAGIVSLARFSQAFLLLKTMNVGVDPAFVPLVLVLVNAVNAAISYPLGVLADGLGMRPLLLAGALILLVAEVVLAMTTGAAGTAVGAALWGLQIGALQGLLAAAIADAIPEDLRGTAFGLFDFLTGIAALASSVIAGTLWLIGGPFLTFMMGAVFAACAFGVLAVTGRE